MVVAVTAVNMMQVAVDQVVNVVPMRDGRVAAFRSVLVAGVMGSALMIRRAVCWVRFIDRKAVLVHVVRMGVVEMSIV